MCGFYYVRYDVSPVSKEQMIVHMPEWLACIVLQTDDFLASLWLDLTQAAPSLHSGSQSELTVLWESWERGSEEWGVKTNQLSEIIAVLLTLTSYSPAQTHILGNSTLDSWHISAWTQQYNNPSRQLESAALHSPRCFTFFLSFNFQPPVWSSALYR